MHLRLLPLFFAGSVFAQVQGPLPAPPEVDLSPLFYDSQTLGGKKLPIRATAKMHFQRLREVKEPLFALRELSGNEDSRRIVFLLPQFHRNPLYPVGWMKLGAEIRAVQQNLGELTKRLVQVHNTRCIGSEGNWIEDLSNPPELESLALGLQEAFRASAQSKGILAVKKGHALYSDFKTLDAALTEFVPRHALLLDGVGLSLAQMESSAQRFGIEDRELNQSGLALLAQLRALEEELALLDPMTQGRSADAMREMWLGEIDAFQKRWVQPIENALLHLNKERTRLHHDKDLISGEVLGRYVSLTQLLLKEAIDLEGLKNTTAYYRQVPKPESTATPRKLTEDERARKSKLTAERSALMKEYEKLAIHERSKRAAKKVLQRIGSEGSCLVVMGAAHAPGLKKALLAKEKDLAVIEIAPYLFDERKNQ